MGIGTARARSGPSPSWRGGTVLLGAGGAVAEEVDGDAGLNTDLFESVVLEATEGEAGMRVDKFLAEHVKGQSRSYLASLCAGGFVLRCNEGLDAPVMLKKSGKVSGQWSVVRGLRRRLMAAF